MCWVVLLRRCGARTLTRPVWRQRAGGGREASSVPGPAHVLAMGPGRLGPAAWHGTDAAEPMPRSRACQGPCFPFLSNPSPASQHLRP